MEKTTVVDRLMRLLADSASKAYYGEPVSQLDHALQAAQLAQDAGADDETVIAALLHDIGHLLDEGEVHEKLGVIDHDRQGADYLRQLGFSERIATLVESHVDAKRYLVATNPAYAERLSAASAETLKLQGGPMSAEEAETFANDPLVKDKLRMRSWDEQAKYPEAQVAPLESYRDRLLKHLSLL